MKIARFIWYSRVFPKRYVDFVKKYKPLSGKSKYTRNQWKFANYLLKNEKKFSSIGNMEQVFEDVRNYWRSKN